MYYHELPVSMYYPRTGPAGHSHEAKVGDELTIEVHQEWVSFRDKDLGFNPPDRRARY